MNCVFLDQGKCCRLPDHGLPRHDGDMRECEHYTPDDTSHRIGEDVAHQEHYESLPVQPIEVMLASFTREEMIGFLRGNIIKYRLRMGRKQGTDDAAKMRQYKKWLDEYVYTGTIAQFTRIDKLSKDGERP